MVAAATLMVAMLAAFSRLKAAAEVNAASDSLTGLANRRSAYLALAGMVARARRSRTPLTVIELDLDHFKAVNDRFGHPAGDALLTEVGAALTASLRGGDVPARVGGEEFLVLLPDTDQEAAELVAERLRSVIADLDESPDGRYVRASLGVATLDPGDVDGADLLRRVDRALYVAKESGRNRVVTALPDAENVPTP
jgi:diguanylate cyclase (GGDEF)-like protein